MPNSLYAKYRQVALEGGIAYLTDNIKAVLVDFDTYGKAITGVTNATPAVVTSTAHGFANGDLIVIGKVGGSTGINNLGTGTKLYAGGVTANTFAVYSDIAQTTGVAAGGAYTSGGVVASLTTDQFLAAIASGARIATSGNLASKTSNQAPYYGVADAADFTWTAVTGAQSEAVVVYKDTGSAATSNLIAFIDQATNLPVTPNSGDITVTLDNGVNRIFAL